MVVQSLPEEFFRSKYLDESKNHITLQAILYSSRMPEKSIWSDVMQALNVWLKAPKDKYDYIAKTMRLIHVINNTLCDSSDDIPERKGTPTPAKLYGMTDALNSSYYSTFVVLERLRDLDKIDAIKYVNQYYLEYAKGAGMEVYWRDNLRCPTEEEYIRMGQRKTGGLLKLAVQLLQLYSSDTSDYSNLLTLLGKFFHIYDDYLSLYDMDDYLLNKNGIEHVTEGKFSFPIIYAITNKPNDAQLINILRQKSKYEEVLEYCVTLTEDFGGVEYAKKTLLQLREEIDKELKKFKENPDLKKILDNACAKLNVVKKSK